MSNKAVKASLQVGGIQMGNLVLKKVLIFQVVKKLLDVDNLVKADEIPRHINLIYEVGSELYEFNKEGFRLKSPITKLFVDQILQDVNLIELFNTVLLASPKSSFKINISKITNVTTLLDAVDYVCWNVFFSVFFEHVESQTASDFNPIYYVKEEFFVKVAEKIMFRSFEEMMKFFNKSDIKGVKSNSTDILNSFSKSARLIINMDRYDEDRQCQGALRLFDLLRNYLRDFAFQTLSDRKIQIYSSEYQLTGVRDTKFRINDFIPCVNVQTKKYGEQLIFTNLEEKFAGAKFSNTFTVDLSDEYLNDTSLQHLLAILYKLAKIFYSQKDLKDDEMDLKMLSTFAALYNHHELWELVVDFCNTHLNKEKIVTEQFTNFRNNWFNHVKTNAPLNTKESVIYKKFKAFKESFDEPNQQELPEQITTSTNCLDFVGLFNPLKRKRKHSLKMDEQDFEESD